MHPIQTAIADLQAALKDAADVNPVFLRTAEKAEAILALEKVKAGVEELELRVLAVSQEVAEEIGAKDPGTRRHDQGLRPRPRRRRGAAADACQAFALPRIAALEADDRVRARNRIVADAFGELLETVDPTALPAHGGDSTTMVVTVPLDQLTSRLGVATWCDAHHHNPWSKGGKTDLADSILLCGHHHRRP